MNRRTPRARRGAPLAAELPHKVEASETAVVVRDMYLSDGDVDDNA